jgi:hypothetical protein
LAQREPVRYLIAILCAVALAFLPAGGAAMAKQMASGAMLAEACHMMPGDPPVSSEADRSCAEHCMTQVSRPVSFGAVGSPSIANAIIADHASLIDARTPRAADPPETPPPRT